MYLPKKSLNHGSVSIQDGTVVYGVDDVKYGSVFHMIQSKATMIASIGFIVVCPFRGPGLLGFCHRGFKTRDLKQTKKSNLIYAFTRKCPYSCCNYKRNRANKS